MGVVVTISAFGAFPISLALVTAVALVLRAGSEARVGSALLAGFLSLALAVQLVKLGVGRVRPPGHDPSLLTASFPSAHAAQATAWTAVAVVVTRLLVPDRGRALRLAVVAAGILLTLVVGLTRLVLGAHSWSAVAGGGGLGAVFFGLAAALLVIVGSMRHTRRGATDRARADHVRITS